HPAVRSCSFVHQSPPTEIYTLSLHDALPICGVDGTVRRLETAYDTGGRPYLYTSYDAASGGNVVNQVQEAYNGLRQQIAEYQAQDRKSTRLNSSHLVISYAVFCLKKKKTTAA